MLLVNWLWKWCTHACSTRENSTAYCALIISCCFAEFIRQNIKISLRFLYISIHRAHITIESSPPVFITLRSLSLSLTRSLSLALFISWLFFSFPTYSFYEYILFILIIFISPIFVRLILEAHLCLFYTLHARRPNRERVEFEAAEHEEEENKYKTK